MVEVVVIEQLTTVTRKGQVTIPIESRRELNLHEGDKVAFSVLPGESVAILVRPVRSVAEMTYGLAAAFAPQDQTREPSDLAAAREALEKEMAEQVMASLRQSDEA